MIKNMVKKGTVLCLTLLISTSIGYSINRPRKVLAAYDNSADMTYKHTDTKNNTKNTNLNTQSCDYETALDTQDKIPTSKDSGNTNPRYSNSLLPSDSNKSSIEVGNTPDILKNQLKELGKNSDKLNSTDNKNVNIDKLSKEQDLLKQKLSSN